MFLANFDKQQVEQWIESLRADRPPEPPPGGWDRDSMLLASAVAHGGAFLKDATAFQDSELGRSVGPELHAAEFEDLAENFDPAIRFFSSLAIATAREEFDATYEPNVEINAYSEGGHRHWNITKGLRSNPPDPEPTPALPSTS